MDMRLQLAGGFVQRSNLLTIPLQPLNGLPELRHGSQPGADAIGSSARYNRRERTMRQSLPEKSRPHQAINNRRGFVRIDRNDRMSSYEKPGIRASDTVPAIGIQSLAFNVPDVEISAEGSSDFDLKGPAPAPEIHAGRVAITAVKCDGVALGAGPRIYENPHDIGSEPMHLFNFAFVPAKPNRRTVNRDFRGFQVQKL